MSMIIYLFVAIPQAIVCGTIISEMISDHVSMFSDAWHSL